MKKIDFVFILVTYNMCINCIAQSSIWKRQTSLCAHKRNEMPKNQMKLPRKQWEMNKKKRRRKKYQSTKP